MSADQRDPSAVARRCADAVERELPPALERVAGPSSADPTVVMVHRIDVDLTVAADGRPEDIGRALAARIWSQVVSAPVGDGVVRFSSPAEKLARFLEEVVTGTAWQRWYHREVAGLALVPTAQILRTLATTRQGDLVAALAVVSPTTFRRLRSEADRVPLAEVSAVFGAAEVARSVRPNPTGARTEATSNRHVGQAAPTAFGGAILLLPSLVGEQVLEAAGASDLRRRVVELALDRRIDDDDPVLALLVGLDGGDEPLDDGAFDDGALVDRQAEDLAHRLLRTFARSILGTGESSDGYLREQFLDGSGTVLDLDPDRAPGSAPEEPSAQGSGVRWIATVDEPPMSVLLRLSGYSSRRVELPWAGGRRVHVSLGTTS